MMMDDDVLLCLFNYNYIQTNIVGHTTSLSSLLFEFEYKINMSICYLYGWLVSICGEEIIIRGKNGNCFRSDRMTKIWHYAHIYTVTYRHVDFWRVINGYIPQKLRITIKGTLIYRIHACILIRSPPPPLPLDQNNDFVHDYAW